MADNIGYSIDKGVIVINRGLTALDLFVRDFIEILKKHSDYLVVSGFVSICSGRTRATEDVDVLFPFMSEDKFGVFFDVLTKNDFWCYQGDDAKEVYGYIKQFFNVRFARKGEMFPNIEFVPINKSKKIKWFELTHSQKIRIRDFEFKIPPIEFEILYKELVLKGRKDLEDARHLRTFFADFVKNENFIKFKDIIKG